MAVATQRTVDLGAALAAGGPHPDHAEELMLFGQFVGEWELDWACFAESGEQVETERGEWIFAWVLEGRAIQDVWIIPERARRGEPGMPPGEYGTTLRVYHPRLDAWVITWNGPIQGVRRLFLGRRSGPDIVLEGQNEDGYPMRWIFSEITERSFRWTSVVSTDGEETWRLREEMRVRRKAP
jgi:hypothetical protein